MFLEKREKNALTPNLTLYGFSLDCVKALKYFGVVLDKFDIVNFIKMQRIKWEGYVVRIDKNCTNKNVFSAQPIGIRNGSLLDFAQGAGIGVFSHLFSFYLHAGPLTTHFDDSTFALQALSNYNENNCLCVQNCRELLGKIKGKIVFQWVPSHCGLWGNERADFLAKKGMGILQNFRRDLTLHSAKLEIKSNFRESFRLTASRVARDKPWSTLCKKSHGIPSSPRAAAVAKFRLLTGHDCLCAHLFRFNLVTSPICVLCDTGHNMTAAHLDEYSALNDLNCIVKRYWRARCLMT
ncbi:uncharacterized protein LOC103524116 [Trichonephila clavipes]|nr:uncharacterized protein LOC103524116 [Trichonephila clavipes]